MDKSLKSKVIVLATLVVGVALFFAVRAHVDHDVGATLTEQEITGLPDAELSRRMRVDLVARFIAPDGHAVAIPAEIRPVYHSVMFEDARSAIGLAGAMATPERQTEVVEAYVALGASPVAELLRAYAPGQPPAKGVDAALSQALANADLTQRRLAWVRSHAKAFAVH